MENKTDKSVNVAQEGSKFIGNLWLPVAGSTLGAAAGTYWAWKKGSGTLGYLGWFALGSIAGTLITAPIVMCLAKKQANGIAKKLDSGADKKVAPAQQTGPGAVAPVAGGKLSSATGDIESQIIPLSNKIYKRFNGGKEQSAAELADFKKTWGQLDGEAKKVVLSVYNFIDALPAPGSVPAKSEAEAMKQMESLMTPAMAEKMKAFNKDAWQKANNAFSLENILPMALSMVYKYQPGA